MGIVAFFKRAFSDMKEGAKAQHAVDRAEFAAVKAESKASFEEARAKGKPETHKMRMKAERDARIADANKRKEEAQARISAAKRH